MHCTNGPFCFRYGSTHRSCRSPCPLACSYFDLSLFFDTLYGYREFKKKRTVTSNYWETLKKKILDVTCNRLLLSFYFFTEFLRQMKQNKNLKSIFFLCFNDLHWFTARTMYFFFYHFSPFVYNSFFNDECLWVFFLVEFCWYERAGKSTLLAFVSRRGPFKFQEVCGRLCCAKYDHRLRSFQVAYEYFFFFFFKRNVDACKWNVLDKFSPRFSRF